MKLHRVSALAALLIATLCVGVGTAYADPARVDQTVTSLTSLSPDGRSVDTALDSGAFSLSKTAAAVDITNDSGATLATIPLRYSIAGVQFEIDPVVSDDGRFLSLTPTTTPIAGTLAVTPVDQDTAYANMLNEIEIGWQNGGATATAVGAGIGFVVGCIFFILGGCIPGAAIGAGIGAVTGISNANPAVTPAVFDYLETL
ncbi:hypothetical protein BFN03_00405 [Rhodococcus sp. WMMA185]|uniref:hypothetical protein n=1 Tax=Rhodococcus sp. WMMA185 TaxID=679318 RepID=UPI0008786BC4|nr:hypothetical protein [Rhodococcus sp. WMMA185]AOW94204.1 hypothetical protein BFN03_00405 [Rhodococcus sp. WMMA185]